MGKPLKFDYYYGIEAEQFSFYRVPRLLVKDERFRKLSSDAKLLYGLMLDRMALSMKNGWLDDENRAYIIYSVENVMEDLGCSKPTCIKIIKELDTGSGIGLIEKKRRGLGKPDIIYVKNFASIEEKNSGNADESTEVKNLYFKKERNFTSGSKETELQEGKESDLQREKIFTSRGKEIEPQEVKESDLQRERDFTSESKETGLLEVKKFAPNHTDFNHTEKNNTDLSYTNPINQSGDGRAGLSAEADEKRIDGMDETSAYIALIRKNLDYDHRESYGGQYGDVELFEEIYAVICDVVCVKRKTVHINGEEYPYELVKSRFLKLDGSHVQYVMGCMKETTTKITNIRAYLITALYNAPSTINHYYQQEVQHDMYGGGWAEKGIV